MVDSVAVLPPGFRVLDAQGAPVSGAKLKFYEGGTSTPKTVYSDEDLGSAIGTTAYTRSDGFVVASQGSGTVVPVYIGTGLYDLVITDSNDVDIWPRQENLKGALDTSTFLTSSSTSTLSIPVVTTSGPTLTLAASHRGKLVECNSSGGNIALTLTAAATLGDGWNTKLRKSSGSNAVSLTTTGSESIKFAGAAHTSLSLKHLGEGFVIHCDGTAFYVKEYTPPLFKTFGIIIITDRVSAAPSSPTGGNRYIVTGAFSTFSVGDIIEYDGVSGYITYTPSTDCGWIAYVQDEDINYQFRGSAWVAWFAVEADMEAATSATLGVTPAAVKHHPGVVKAHAFVTVSGGTPTLTGGHNVASVTDGGTGSFTVNFTTNMADANFTAIVSVQQANPSGSRIFEAIVISKAVGSVQVQTLAEASAANTNAVLTDDISFNILVLGPM